MAREKKRQVRNNCDHPVLSQYRQNASEKPSVSVSSLVPDSSKISADRTPTHQGSRLDKLDP